MVLLFGERKEFENQVIEYKLRPISLVSSVQNRHFPNWPISAKDLKDKSRVDMNHDEINIKLL